MLVFSSDSRGIEAWGPTASVEVVVDALERLIDNTWVLTNFSIGAREIVDIRQCFHDVSFLYALGNNQSACQITLTFAIFIGRMACKGEAFTHAIKDGLDKYVEKRVSEKKAACKIGIGDFARMGYLVSIDIGNADVEKGICTGTLTFNMELKS